MKILQVSGRADVGGGPEHMLQLSAALDDEVEIWVACPNEAPYWDRFSDLVGSSRMLSIPHRRLTIATFFSLIKLIRENQIGIVHSHGKAAGVYSRICGFVTRVPVVHTFHGVHVGAYSPFVAIVYGYIERLLASVSSALIAVSSGEADEIANRLHCGGDKLRIIENGVRLPKARDLRSALGRPDNVVKVLTVTRFNEQKNPGLLLEIARRAAVYPSLQFKFQVLGTGPQYDHWKRRFERDAPHASVEFLGSVDSIEPFLREADVFLSTSRWEGMPLALLEAMAVGLPVVASDVVGNRDVIETGQTGLLFALDDPEAGLAALIEVSESFDARRRMAAAARAAVLRRFSVEKMAQAVLGVYRSISLSR